MADHDKDTSKDRIIQHQYDGIQEYDNPMPRWWLLTFAGTVIFSIIYYFNVGPIGNGKGRIADYEAEMAAFAAAYPAPTGTVSAEQIIALVSNPQAVADGQKTFAAYCSSCHRADGGGMIGPNLADDAWLHGHLPTDIHSVIAEGVLEKGMPGWSKVLKPEQLDHVVAYVITLRGSNPANPKPPQGTVVQP